MKLLAPLLLLSLAVALPTPAAAEECEDRGDVQCFVECRVEELLEDEECEAAVPVETCFPPDTGVVLPVGEDGVPVCVPGSVLSIRSCPEGMRGALVMVLGRPFGACVRI